ncbi:MAG: hypothetical protein U0T77_07455 [Chitinophagales bacterium]
MDEKAIQQHEPHCASRHQRNFCTPNRIADYTTVSKKYAEKIKAVKGVIELNQKVIDIQHSPNDINVITNQGSYSTKLLINCAGLYSDKIAQMTQNEVAVKKLFRSAVNTIP